MGWNPNSQRALDLSHKRSAQLPAAETQIKDLEADVRYRSGSDSSRLLATRLIATADKVIEYRQLFPLMVDFVAKVV
jgi:hypothetical protein